MINGILPTIIIHTLCFFTQQFFLFKELEGSSDKHKHVGIFTIDYSKPWLSVVCSNVVLEE